MQFPAWFTRHQDGASISTAAERRTELRAALAAGRPADDGYREELARLLGESDRQEQQGAADKLPYGGRPR